MRPDDAQSFVFKILAVRAEIKALSSDDLKSGCSKAATGSAKLQKVSRLRDREEENNPRIVGRKESTEVRNGGR